MKKKILIVCRFKENISWVYEVKNFDSYIILQKYDSKMIGGSIGTKQHKNFQSLLFSEIINKGRLEEFLNEVPEGLFPNIGMESHAFFTFIVDNYNVLDYTGDQFIFCQGNPFDHCKDFMQIISNIKDDETFLDIGKLMESEDDGAPTERGIPVGKIYEELFEKKSPGKFYFTAGSMFMTSKENIYKHSIDFYQKCVDISLREVYAPWVFERLYKTIFQGE
jgi:hypothetical protein